MSYILLNKGQVVGITNETPFTGTPKLKEFPGITYDAVKNARGSDMKSFEEAEQIAAALITLTGETYLAFDNGTGTSHRYGVTVPPKVGDDVSYGFNGDYYPCGKVVRITKGWRVYTDSGKTFNRRKNSSGWMMAGGTWGLVSGHISEQNPHL